MSITGYIPGFPQVSWERRYGDAQLEHDKDGNAIVFDGGEPTLFNKLYAYCKNKKITHITYVLTHWHLDHDSGLKSFLECSGVCVDKIYCPPPSEIRYLEEDGHADDYNRANRRINLAKSLGKPIVYIPAGTYTDIQVGEIKCRLWRRAANKKDQNDREINNTSIQAYFPDLYYLTGGDMIDKAAFLATKPGKVVMMKGYHHGNGDGSADLKVLTGWGVKLYWYNNVEARGVPIGGSDFSKWGAGKAKGLIETVLRTDSDIIFTAGNKRLKVQKGASVWTFDVPYDGTGVAGWGQGEKGRWYQFEDGTYAVGWNQLEWSKGKDWFYFNENGIMCTGWYWDKDLKAWYYLDPATGIMHKNGPVHVDSYWYYLDGYGRLITGWYNPGDGNRYLEPEVGKNMGHMYVNCTATIDGQKYKFDGYGYATAVIDGLPGIIKNTGFKGYNVTKPREKVQYIVIHYVGSESTAANNVIYFNGADRQASADYFVGHAGEICEYNPDIDHQYSWHCGGGKQSSKGGTFYGKCTNKNSIGIELCTKKSGSGWTFSELTLDSAAKLTSYLMQKYGVPAENVIRHFDVTGKNCPGVSGWGYTGGDAEWNKWKARLTSKSDSTPTVTHIYRVRKSWEDSKSQLGAFKILENAKKRAAENPGYFVFDENGNKV